MFFFFLFILVLMSLLSVACSSHLETLPVPSGNGFVKIRIDQTHRINHYDTVIHKINISEFEKHFEAITNDLPTNPVLLAKVNQIHSLLGLFSRSKRELFNFIGEAQNFYTGL